MWVCECVFHHLHTDKLSAALWVNERVWKSESSAASTVEALCQSKCHYSSAVAAESSPTTWAMTTGEGAAAAAVSGVLMPSSCPLAHHLSLNTTNLSPILAPINSASKCLLPSFPLALFHPSSACPSMPWWWQQRWMQCSVRILICVLVQQPLSWAAASLCRLARHACLSVPDTVKIVILSSLLSPSHQRSFAKRLD